MTAEVFYGAGRHYETLDPLQKIMAVKLNWISQPFAIFSGGVGKVSVALLLLKIMPKNKFRQWFLYILIALMTIINAICVAFIFGQCSPVQKLWEPSISGNCLRPYVQQDIGIFRASFSCLSDFLLALFPLLVIYKLQTRRAIKLGLGCAMSLGLFATGAAIVKTIQLPDLSARDDYTYDTVDLVIWFTTEMYTIIIAASVPTLRPLLPLLYGKSPTQKRNPRKWDAHLSASHRRKRAHCVHEDEDVDRLRMIPFSRSYEYSTSSRETHVEIKGAGDMRRDVDAESGGVILAKPDSNEIMKTTEVDVSVRNEPLPKSAAPFARRDEMTTYAEIE